ncbi:hypothetical protein [Phenylobacterium sp.]|jgi:uridine kinase|uniref:hypothetical protein n=1 Tax=Phenylobacterium sp. TaxID=1871053 RepID=UPI0025CE7226|nr:hypothetical protein [Phenylobacterium sp.]
MATAKKATAKEVKEMKTTIDEMTKAIQEYEGLVARQQVQIRMLEEFANGIIQRSGQLQLDVQNMNKALASQQQGATVDGNTE